MSTGHRPQFNRILCPTDFSPHSAHALAHAAEMARYYKSQLNVLHVVHTVSSGLVLPPVVSPATLHPIPWEQYRAELWRACEPARGHGVDPVPDLLEGVPARTILDHALATRADLVVMGTHGRSGFERLVLGSVTEKVLRQAPCPVLVVPPREPEGKEAPSFRRILCPVDFSKPSLRALDHALSLAEEQGGHVTLLHVVEWPVERTVWESTGVDVHELQLRVEDEVRRELRAAVPDDVRTWCDVEEIVDRGRVFERVLAHAGDADLVAMGVHGRGALDVMLFGSATHHVVRQARCPVLTVR